MQLQQAVNSVFVQLSGTLQQLSDDEYAKPCTSLFKNTIGQHVRHIIELFECLENGYSNGIVCYEKRKRDVLIENDKQKAEKLLQQIYTELDKPNKELVLEACYDDVSNEQLSLSTNYYREIAYNLEHTIHHMALIRTGVNEVSHISLPEDFGVASSTIKYRKQCAQ
jgi:hypothetical protein